MQGFFFVFCLSFLFTKTKTDVRFLRVAQQITYFCAITIKYSGSAKMIESTVLSSNCPQVILK